jgi:23S rRNA (cytidine1920-2'-O)/16S rRNA (cytidine1409-2'-O)-methyltransferase
MTDRRPQRPRLDTLLVERGLAPTVEKARAHVLAGEVVVGERRADKPGERIAADAAVRLRLRTLGDAWVSRAAGKLLHALDTFGLDPKDQVLIDLGASTGGFTEVLLRRGARRVYAVDVGHNQLHARLRVDPRVVVLEQTHARDLDATRVPEPADALVADVSFISLRAALPAPLERLAPVAWVAVLVKPQFEARRDEVQPGGRVDDPEVVARVCREVAECLEARGFHCEAPVDSPVPGAQSGNVERLLVARRGAGSGPVWPERG